jgi:hypothetical protein
VLTRRFPSADRQSKNVRVISVGPENQSFQPIVTRNTLPGRSLAGPGADLTSRSRPEGAFVAGFRDGFSGLGGCQSPIRSRTARSGIYTGGVLAQDPYG